MLVLLLPLFLQHAASLHCCCALCKLQACPHLVSIPSYDITCAGPTALQKASAGVRGPVLGPVLTLMALVTHSTTTTMICRQVNNTCFKTSWSMYPASSLLQNHLQNGHITPPKRQQPMMVNEAASLQVPLYAPSKPSSCSVTLMVVFSFTLPRSSSQYVTPKPSRPVIIRYTKKGLLVTTSNAEGAQVP